MAPRDMIRRHPRSRTKKRPCSVGPAPARGELDWATLPSTLISGHASGTRPLQPAHGGRRGTPATSSSAASRQGAATGARTDPALRAERPARAGGRRVTILGAGLLVAGARSATVARGPLLWAATCRRQGRRAGSGSGSCNPRGRARLFFRRERRPVARVASLPKDEVQRAPRASPSASRAAATVSAAAPPPLYRDAHEGPRGRGARRRTGGTRRRLLASFLAVAWVALMLPLLSGRSHG